MGPPRAAAYRPLRKSLLKSQADHASGAVPDGNDHLLAEEVDEDEHRSDDQVEHRSAERLRQAGALAEGAARPGCAGQSAEMGHEAAHGEEQADREESEPFAEAAQGASHLAERDGREVLSLEARAAEC